MNTIFIGNRCNVFQKIIENKSCVLTEIFVVENSYLHQMLKNSELNYKVFTNTTSHKNSIIQYLKDQEYDLLISNGCPFILPIAELKKDTRYFLNIHPTFLPELKGKTPLNGVLFLNYNFIGATIHFMDDGIDTGNIVYQEKIELTPEIDQGLIYFLSFHLEGLVFDKGIDLLLKSDFAFTGKSQKGGGTYFNRTSEIFCIDFNDDKNIDIIRKVKSVGIIYQGIQILGQYKVFEAEEIVNKYLLELFKLHTPGDMLLKYSNKLLVKSVEGVIKFSFLDVE